MESESPALEESADVCRLQDCYICDLGKPIATDLLLNTTSWTSILKLVLAVLHTSDLGKTKEYFSNNEITRFVFCHWERISGSKEWKSRISDCLSHNKKSFESQERGKWRMKDMSQVGTLIDKLKRLHNQSTPTPLSPALSSPASSPLIRRRGRKPFSESRTASSSKYHSHSPRLTVKEEKTSDSESPSSPHNQQHYSPPGTPYLPSYSPTLSHNMPSSPIPPNTHEMDQQRNTSYIPPHTFGIPYLHLNDESPPASPIYLSPRNATPPSSSHPHCTTPSYSTHSYSSPYAYPPIPPSPSMYTSPSTPYFINLPPPSFSSYSHIEMDIHPERRNSYSHPVDRDMLDLFNRKSHLT